MSDLKAIEAEMTRTLNLKGEGADEERARILWYIRRDADNADDDDLRGLADAIEAGFHWDMTDEEQDAFDAELAAEE